MHRHAHTHTQVCKGFYGESDQTAVTTGDIFNFHFTKNTKVVVVETKEVHLIAYILCYR